LNKIIDVSETKNKVHYPFSIASLFTLDVTITLKIIVVVVVVVMGININIRISIGITVIVIDGSIFKL
jgi:hypothetical protein